MENKTLIEYLIEYLDVLGIVSGFVFVIIPLINAWRSNKAIDLMRSSFENTISGIFSDNISNKISSAILLRRFLNKHSKEGKHRDTYRMETINVISSLLKNESSGEFQKVLADSFSYTKNLDKCDFQYTNLHNMFLEANYDTLIDDYHWSKRWFKMICHRQLERSRLRKYRIKSDKNIIRTSVRIALRAKWLWRMFREINKFLIKRGVIRLSMRNADFFMANLSQSTIRNADAKEVVFYKCNLHNVTFRNCNFTKANFAGAYTKGVRFIDCILTDVDLSNCYGGKPSIIYSDKRVIDKNIKRDLETSKILSLYNSKCTDVNVFISSLGDLSQEHLLLYKNVVEILSKNNVTTKNLLKKEYLYSRTLPDISSTIDECDGLVAIAFKDTVINDGIYRKNTPEACPITNKSITSPWIHTEIGLVIGLGKPILLLHEDGVTEGVFEEVIKDGNITQIHIGKLNHDDIPAIIHEWVLCLAKNAKDNTKE